MKPRKHWKHGDKAMVAREAGIPPQRFNDYLKGRRACGPDTASKLEEACKQHGYDIPAALWLTPRRRINNPLFE